MSGETTDARKRREEHEAVVEHRARQTCICGKEWPCPDMDRLGRCIAVTAEGKPCPHPANDWLSDGTLCRLHKHWTAPETTEEHASQTMDGRGRE